jgi:endogenous inhibitor of DNA gyrase (YacG/DUF329 family)
MKFDKSSYEKSKMKQLVMCSCDHCGKSFKRAKHQISISIKRCQNELFCSTDCSYRHKSKKHNYLANCKTCGLKVDYPKVFCNSSCSARFTNKKRIRKKGIIKNTKCAYCGIDFEVSLYSSCRNSSCKECKVKNKIKLKKHDTIAKECCICQKPIEKGKKNKTCSEKCKKIAMSKGAKKGGVISVLSQQRRSKNEVLFYSLCKNTFPNVLHNEPVFNGWDADIIFPDLKVAVLWNGLWHYKKITQKHSIKQVQNRDKLKIKEIKKFGYLPYIVKDTGKYNKNKVKNEFFIFCKWLYEKGIAGESTALSSDRLMRPTGSLTYPR